MHMLVCNVANLVLRPLFLLPCGLGMRLHHITKLHILVMASGTACSRQSWSSFFPTWPVELVNGLHLADLQLESEFTHKFTM